MARTAEPHHSKLDLATAHILIVGDKSSEQDILAQMLVGFGVPGIQRRASAEEGVRAIDQDVFDLCLIDGSMKDEGGYELVKQVRANPKDVVRHMPVVLVCGHLRKSDVFRARDCGAHFVLTKPLSPRVLFDRIVWLAREQRDFVSCDTYCGPDRRLKAFGPPLGMSGRRAEDLSEHIGEAKEANLSQDAVDSFFETKKASIL